MDSPSREDQNGGGDLDGTREGESSLTEPLIDCDETQLRNDSSSSTARHDEHEDDVDGNVADANNDAFAEDDDSENEHYLLDPQRFVVLAVFCLNNLLGSACWITFAPIEDVVEIKYQQSQLAINWLSTIFMAVYGPGTALCAWTVPKFGFRETVVFSSITMFIGCFLRWWSCGSSAKFGFVLNGDDLGNYYHTEEDWSSPYSLPRYKYSTLLLGQGLVALGQTVFLNAPARLAASWFQHTTKAIGAVVFAGNIGIVLGQTLSPLFVVEETGEHLDVLLAAQGVAMGICALLTCYYFRSDEPAIPPSAAEAVRRRQRRQYQQRQQDNGDDEDGNYSLSSPINSTFETISKDLHKLLTDRQYIILLIAFGIQYAVNNAILTLLQPWVASSGFPGDETAGTCGSFLIAGGVVGTFIAATLLDFTRNYNQAIRWSFFVACGLAFELVAALQPNSPTWFLITSFTITGMSQMSLLTICLDAAAAHTYPVPEELSAAGLQLVGQYFGIILIYWMGHLIENNHEDKNPGADHRGEMYGFNSNVNIAYVVLNGISATVGCCYKSDNPRSSVHDDDEGEDRGPD